MKKFLFTILAAISLAALTSCNPNVSTDENNDSGNSARNEIVETGKCGDNMTWTVKEISPYSLELIFEGSGEMENFFPKDSIPLVMRNVTPWAHYSNFITKITVNEGITSICNWAFYNIAAVKEVKLPKTLKVINPCVFECMNFLEKLTIPASVEKIGAYAFAYCQKATITFEDTEGWFKTSDPEDWNAKTNGTAVNMNEIIDTLKANNGVGSYFYKE